MIHDYRLNPWTNVMEIKAISGETHQIPTSSPYTVRLNEVPQKTDPSTLKVYYSGGAALTEVAATPEAGQFWPDYNTTEHGVDDWNTGTLLFNAADAGKTIKVSYNGIGALVDDRVASMLEITVTSSTQPERDLITDNVPVSYDSTMTTNCYSKNKILSTRGRLRTHKGLAAGTYTLQRLLQNLVNLSHTQEYVKETYYSQCDCNCDCN